MPTKNYDYRINDLVISDGSSIIRSQNLVWWWKDFLARAANTAPWTVEGSSDASTAGMDAVDRWTTSFVAALVVYDNPGTPHSWIVLKSPGLIGTRTWYILFDYNRNNFWEQCDITLSDAEFTGGSTSNGPTTVGNTYFYDDIRVRGNEGTGVCHGAIADDGTFWMSYARAGAWRSLWIMTEIDNMRTGDTESFASYFSDGLDTDPLDDWGIFSATGDLFGPANVGTIDPYRWDAGSTRLASTMGIDAAENRWVKWPLWVWYNDAALPGQSIKGLILEVEIAIGGIQGDIHDDTGTIVATHVGPVWLPADAAPSLTG